jgi:hypothetical protein
MVPVLLAPPPWANASPLNDNATNKASRPVVKRLMRTSCGDVNQFKVHGPPFAIANGEPATLNKLPSRDQSHGTDWRVESTTRRDETCDEQKEQGSGFWDSGIRDQECPDPC